MVASSALLQSAPHTVARPQARRVRQAGYSAMPMWVRFGLPTIIDADASIIAAQPLYNSQKFDH